MDCAPNDPQKSDDIMVILHKLSVKYWVWVMALVLSLRPKYQFDINDGRFCHLLINVQGF